MRPGLSADDIYIMVEDEFYAVAQTFTKHLHHAEYIRLRKAAKDRNASTVSNISRPVDSITTMREETRRKKEAEAREARMKAATESIKGSKRAKGLLDESDISDFEDDRRDDPWQGTHLQRFMTTSPKKALTGLTGLQGVTSHTRAAAGYSKPEKRPPQPSRPFESARPKADASETVTVPQAASDASSDTDDDDLDAPSRLSSRPPARIPPRPPTITAAKPTPLSTSKPPPYRLPKAKASTSPPANTPRVSFLEATPRAAPTPIPTSSRPSKKPTPPDPSPPVRPVALQETRPSLSDVRQRLKARREREENERRKASGGIGVDEIPVFLV